MLFVCVHNAGRSQMAAAFLNHLAGDRIEVRSAGSAPADTVNPAAVAAMAEVGIGLSAQTPKAREAVEELGLEPGVSATARVKSTNVHMDVG